MRYTRSGGNSPIGFFLFGSGSESATLPPMDRPGVMRQHLWIWSAVLALWALLVLMVSGQMVFTADLAWDTALQLAVRYWCPGSA